MFLPSPLLQQEVWFFCADFQCQKILRQTSSLVNFLVSSLKVMNLVSTMGSGVDATADGLQSKNLLDAVTGTQWLNLSVTDISPHWQVVPITVFSEEVEK